MVTSLAITANAADETLTLACQGTVEQDAKREPISTGIIVNLTNRKLHGLVFPDTQVEVTQWNEGVVAFGRNEPDLTIEGIINRVTGELRATVRLDAILWRYSLTCTPAQRRF
jgi:hypothetical protein